MRGKERGSLIGRRRGKSEHWETEEEEDKRERNTPGDAGTALSNHTARYLTHENVKETKETGCKERAVPREIEKGGCSRRYKDRRWLA